jgi:hypothetical protein
VNSDFVSRAFQGAFDFLVCPSLVVTDEVCDILQDNVARLPLLEYLWDAEQDRTAPTVFEAFLVTRLGKWLTRKACAQEIMRWNVGRINFTDVSRRQHPEVGLVEPSERLVDFTRKDTLAAKRGGGNVESPKPSEYVGESHSR